MPSIIKTANTLLENKYTPLYQFRQIKNKLEKSNQAQNEAIQALITTLEAKIIELKALYKKKQVNFSECFDGALGIMGRPSHDKIEHLKEAGVTTVITLLKSTEKDVEALGAKVKKLEMNWIWFPLSASNLPLDIDFKKQTNKLYLDLIERLKAGEKILIHCAAGVHRTGAFTNGLLLKMNFTEEAAKAKIYEMRPVTALEAISKHWQWSRAVISEQ